MTENILKINNLNKKYDAFHENLMQVVNKNVPLKEMSNKEIKKKKTLDYQRDHYVNSQKKVLSKKI